MSTPAAADAPLVIDRIDHLVLTVADIDQTVDFYVRVLGMPVTFGAGRRALRFGRHKLNLHQAGRELEPKAHRPTPGSADVCLVTTTPLDQVAAHLRACQVPVEQGPVARTGATGPITSLYCRDPDGNLIEISTYHDVEAKQAEGGDRASANRPTGRCRAQSPNADPQLLTIPRTVDAIQQRLTVVLQAAEQALEHSPNRSTLRVF